LKDREGTPKGTLLKIVFRGEGEVKSKKKRTKTREGVS